MALRDWSTTAANNNSSSPDGFPEGMAPSGVNNSAREVMAQIRTWYENPGWTDLGHTPTRVDNDTFTVATDLTATYVAGRRLRFTGGATSYGTVSSSSYSAPDTTVNVTMDSGNLPNPLTTVSLGYEIATGPVQPYHRITAAEIAAGVTPTNYQYEPGDLRRYGAAADGITDDTSAVVTAIAAASQGGAIYAYGRFRITSTITVDKRVSILGRSPLTTYATRTAGDGFVKDNAMTTAAFNLAVDGIAMSGLTLDCESGNTGDGITVSANGISLRDLAVYGDGRDGIRIGDTAGTLNCNSFHIEHVRADYNGRDGIRIDSATGGGSVNANAGLLSRVSCQNNTGSGIYLLGGQWNVLLDVHCEVNGEYGLRLGSGAQLNMVYGGDRELNATADLRLDYGANSNGLIGVAESEISDAGISTFRITNSAVSVGQSAIGRAFGNGNGPALSSNDVYMALAADAIERIRIGLSGNSVATGLVAAQILAFSSTLMIASRDTATGAIEFRAGSGIPVRFSVTGVGPFLPSYTVATLPAATTASGLIYVSDETGGAIPAFSDGTNWRRVTDRAVVA